MQTDERRVQVSRVLKMVLAPLAAERQNRSADQTSFLRSGVKCRRGYQEDTSPSSQRYLRCVDSFDDLCSLLESAGFAKRTKGGHNIFRKAGVEERINLQRDGNNAKPYQVKQVRAVLLKYKLG